MTQFERVHMPSFAGATEWLDSEPLGPAELRGHVVLANATRTSMSYGEAPGPSHGVDVDEDGTGALRDGRLYQPVREHQAVRRRTLEITFLEPGAEAHSFTSG